MNKNSVAFFTEQIELMIENENKLLGKMELEYKDCMENKNKFERSYEVLLDKIDEKMLSFFSNKKEKNEYTIIILKILGYEIETPWQTFMDIVADFESFKLKLTNYDIENIDEECHKIMHTIRTKYEITTNINSIFKEVPPEFHNLMLWICAIFLHEEKKKEIKLLKASIKELEEKKATTFLTMNQINEQIQEMQTTKIKFQNKITYLKETLARLKQSPSDSIFSEQEMFKGLENFDNKKFEYANKKFKEIFTSDVISYTTEEEYKSIKVETKKKTNNQIQLNDIHIDAEGGDASFEADNDNGKDPNKYGAVNTSKNQKYDKNGSKLKKNLNNKKSRTRLKEVAQMEDGVIDVKSKCCLSCLQESKLRFYEFENSELKI